MSKRISRGRRPGVEVLERRETAAASPLAVQAIAFSGIEQVSFPKLHTVPSTGGLTLTGTGTVNVTGVGTLKAKVTFGVAPDLRSFSLVESLDDGMGDQTTLGINGYYRNRINNSTTTRAYIVANGGTGLFAHTRISGTAVLSPVTSTVYPASKLTISFKGVITPVAAPKP